MLLRMVEWFETWLRIRMSRKVQKIMATLYPDPDERSSAYLAEGAELASTIMFGEGEPLHAIMVSPEGEGYMIRVLEEEYEN